MTSLKNQQGLVVKGSKAKVSFIIKETIVDKYEEILLSKINDVLKVISAYVSKNAANLSTRGPTKRIAFTDTDKDILFKITGITKEEIIKAAKESKLIGVSIKSGKDFAVSGDAFNLLCVCLIFCYFRNRDRLKPINKDSYPAYLYVAIYLAIRFYGSSYISSFPYDPDETVMDYTIENLSKKNKISKMNNVYDLIQYWSKTNNENMVENLIRGADTDLIYYIINFNSRIKSSVKNIAKEFYKNHGDNKRYNIDILQREDEEGEMYVGDIKNISNDIEIISRKIQIKFVYDSIVDLKLLQMACDVTKISKSKMTVIIGKIRDTDETLLKVLITQIISYYLETARKGIKAIRSANFINTMIGVYRISNTTNNFVLKIKEVLDNILKNNSEEYLKTSRQATLSSMKFCLYIYIVLYISRNVE